MKKWMNAGTTYCYNNISFDIEYCRKYGFDAIELKYNRIKNIDCATLKCELKEQNVEVGGIGAIKLPVGVPKKILDGYMEKLNDMCEIASLIGDPYILVNMCDVAEKEYSIANVDGAMECISNFVKVTKRYDKRIALEVTGFDAKMPFHFSDAIQIVNSFRNDGVGLIMDLYHLCGMKEKVSDFYPLHKEDIIVVHVSDGFFNADGSYSDAKRCYPGQGEFDLEKYYKIIRDIKYDGPVSIEVFNAQSGDCNMETCYFQSYNALDDAAKNILWGKVI